MSGAARCLSLMRTACVRMSVRTHARAQPRLPRPFAPQEHMDPLFRLPQPNQQSTRKQQAKDPLFSLPQRNTTREPPSPAPSAATSIAPSIASSCATTSISTASTSSSRGTYSRRGDKGKSAKWIVQVQAHMARIRDGTIHGNAQCIKSTCINGGACARIVLNSSLEDEAVQSFGEGCLDSQGNLINNKYGVIQKWFEKAMTFRTASSQGSKTVYNVRYIIGDKEVCRVAWGYLQGMTPCKQSPPPTCARPAPDLRPTCPHRPALRTQIPAKRYTRSSSAATWRGADSQILRGQ